MQIRDTGADEHRGCMQSSKSVSERLAIALQRSIGQDKANKPRRGGGKETQRQ